MTTGTFIGEYRSGSGGDTVITNPATEQEVASFTASGVSDVDEAAAAARAARPVRDINGALWLRPGAPPPRPSLPA